MDTPRTEVSDDSLPPVLLGEMRLVAQGVDSGTKLGRSLTQQFDRDAGRFIDRLQRLEEKFMDRQGSRQREVGIDADEPDDSGVEAMIERMLGAE